MTGHLVKHGLASGGRAGSSVDSTLAFVASGAVFGLAAGFAPGPLLALVLARSMRYGAREGVKVAVAPLVSDPPIVLLAVFVFARVATTDPILGVVALAGGVLLVYLAVEIVRAPPEPGRDPPGQAGSLLRGVATNLLNPHPYLFWLTVGAPTVVSARAAGGAAPAGFLAAMYGCLIAAKVLVAVAGGQGRVRLAGRSYLLTLRVLAAALAAIGLLSVWDGLRYLVGM